MDENPYLSPQTTTGLAGGARPGVDYGLEDYAAPVWRTRIAVALLTLELVLVGLTVVVKLVERSGFALPFSMLTSIRALNALSSLTHALALGFLCAWIYRSCINVRALGARGFRFRPGWAVVGCIIPYVSYFFAAVVFTEFWKASDPDDRVRTEWKRLGRAPMVWWWLTSGVAFLLLHYVQRDSFAEIAVRSIRLALTIVIVIGVTRRCEAIYRRLLDQQDPHLVTTPEVGEIRA